MTLLQSDEPPAVEVVNADGGSSAVLVCDHASNRVPRRLGSLGLDAAQLADHIGWDPGAADVARRLSVLLDAPLVLSGFSRLVIDCNRPLPSRQCVPERSGGVAVPGNLAMSSADRQRRIDELYGPYHAAIHRLLDARAPQPTLLLSIHSFTPVLHNHARPWHVGISYWRERGFADLWRAALARSGDIVVGDNQPYPIESEIDYTIPVHGGNRGLPSVMIEIRQDQIRSEQQVSAWAARLAQSFGRIEAEALRLLQT